MFECCYLQGPVASSQADLGVDYDSEFTFEEGEEEFEEEGEGRMFGDWEECFDHKYKRVYYVNVNTGQSVWTLPEHY